MSNDDAAVAPDGLVLLPKAWGLTPPQLMEQQALANRLQSQKHAAAQLQNLTFESGVTRLSDTMRGLMDDWAAGDRSLRSLLLSDNRLQGVGLMLVIAGLSGLLIDAVLVR